MDYATEVTRQRRDRAIVGAIGSSPLATARSQSSNTAIESFGCGTRGAIPPEPEDGSKMA